MPILQEIKERLRELPLLGLALHKPLIGKFEIRDKRQGHSWIPIAYDGHEEVYCLAIPRNGTAGFRYTTLAEIFKVSAANDLECYQLNN